MSLDLTEALAQHRRGDLESASRFYEAALLQDPDRPDALYLLGMVALQRGDPGLAATLIGRAVAARPGEADYHSGLAEACRLLGQVDRALAGCREAVRLRPHSPEDLCNLGAILVDTGDVEAAIGSYREALRLRPNFAAAHNNLGNALRIKGDGAAALTHFRAAVQHQPTSAEAHGNLGKILLERGEAEASLAHYREAVRLRPGFAAARVQLGNALLGTGQPEEAETCFREVIRLHPGLAAAHACLAGLLEQRGDLEGSLASIREALRLDPRHAGVLARLATRMRNELPEQDRAMIEGLLASPTLPPDRRWPLLFGLAHVLDALGEFDRAARLVAEANSLQLAETRRQGRGYEPTAYRAFVDQMLTAFTPEFFERAKGWGLESERPVFVVGLPRSGTTLIEQILSSHPKVFGAGELNLARQAFEAFAKLTGQPGTVRKGLDRLEPDQAQQLARQYLDGLPAASGPAERVVDKMPENYVYLGLIATLFPHARLIHCRRDVRDVAVSCYMTNFGQVRWASDPGQIASRVSEYRRLMDHWLQTLPVEVFEVDYEAIVADQERESRALVAFCGLEWDVACLDFHRTQRPVQTASVAQVRRPIHGRSVGRWKNYEQPFSRLLAGLDHSSSIVGD